MFLCILNDLLEAGYEDVPGLGQGGAEYDVALADLESNQSTKSTYILICKSFISFSQNSFIQSINFNLRQNYERNMKSVFYLPKIQYLWFTP